MTQRDFGDVGEKQIDCQQDHCEEDIHPCEVEHVSAFVRTFCHSIVFVGDQARHGGDDSTKAADIHPCDECRIGICEFGEEHSRRYITDKLAGQEGYDDFSAQKQFLQSVSHGRDTSQIADEDEEEYEGQEQVVVQTFQDPFLEEKEPDQNDDENCPVGGNVEYRQQAEQEEDA